MALPKQESFTTGADQALSTYDANWITKDGAFTVAAATDDCTATDQPNLAYWSGDAFNANQYVQAKIVTVAGGKYPGIACRCSAGATVGHGYYFFAAGDSYFGTIDDGVLTDIGGDRGAFAANDIIRIEFNGNTWTLYKNGGSLATGSDSTFTTGACGICFYSNGDRIDDWEGGNLGGGAEIAASAGDGIKFGELPRMTASYQKTAGDGILFGEGSAKRVNYFTLSGDGILLGDAAAFDALVAAGAFQGDAYQNDAYQVVITAGQVLVSVLDGIKFGEFTRMSAAWQALSGDGIRLGDGIGKQVHSFTIAVDGIKVGDAAYSILAQYAAAQDGAKFGDASAFGAHWYPRTLDGIRLGDLVLFTGDNDVFVADGLKLGDGAQAAAEMLARTADQIKFGDAGAITMTWQVSIADGVRFGDVITRILHYFTSLADGVKFRDQSRVNRPATGLLNISVGAKNAGLTFTVVNPGAGFSGTGPGAGFGADEPGVGFGTGQPGITIQGDG